MEERESQEFEAFMKTAYGRFLKALGVDVLSYFKDLSTVGVFAEDFWGGKYGDPDFSGTKEI